MVQHYVVWNAAGERKFEAGVDHGVLYFFDRTNWKPEAVPWNGLTSVEDASSSSDTDPVYLDGVKYLNRRKPSNYAGKISAFTYPTEFEQFLGVGETKSGIHFQDQEVNDTFNLSYRTLIGNDLKSTSAGYKLHLLYNLTASMSGHSAETISETTDPKNFSWDISSIPVRFSGFRPTSHVIIDTTQVDPSIVAEIEFMIYGSPVDVPHLPTPADFHRWG